MKLILTCPKCGQKYDLEKEVKKTEKKDPPTKDVMCPNPNCDCVVAKA